MNTKSILSLTAVVAALALFASPLALGNAFAGSYGDDDGDSIRQSIEQKQSNEQESTIVGGLANVLSGNNVNTQTNLNFGSNSASQD